MRLLRVQLVLLGCFLFKGGPAADGRPADGGQASTLQRMQQQAASTVSMMGSIAPVAAVEVTNTPCNLRALPRIKDERFCDKYYVCSRGVYVGLFCPVGMAFDYSLQECHLRDKVDCTGRPEFAFGRNGATPVTPTNATSSLAGAVTQTGVISAAPSPVVTAPSGATTAPRVPIGGITPTPMTGQTAAQLSGVTPPSGVKLARPTVTQRIPIRRVSAPAGLTVPTTTTSATPATPTTATTTTPRIQTLPTRRQTSAMTLRFGARVTVPAGSAIVLPPGTEIQVANDTSAFGSLFGPLVASQTTGILPSVSTQGQRPGAQVPSLQRPPTAATSQRPHQHRHDSTRDDSNVVNQQRPSESMFDGDVGVINPSNEPAIDLSSDTFDTLTNDDTADQLSSAIFLSP